MDKSHQTGFCWKKSFTFAPVDILISKGESLKRLGKPGVERGAGVVGRVLAKKIGLGCGWG